VPADVGEYRDLLKQKWPQEAKGIDELFDHMAKLKRTLDLLLLVQEGKVFKSLFTLLTKPWLLQPLRKTGTSLSPDA